MPSNIAALALRACGCPVESCIRACLLGLGYYMLRFVTAGESHGQALFAWISGLPAGLPVDTEFIQRELHRRQLGYGRGGRQRIEKDTADILAGVRHGKAIGAPVAVRIENRDWKNWEKALPVEDTGGAELLAGDAAGSEPAVAQPSALASQRHQFQRSVSSGAPVRVAVRRRDDDSRHRSALARQGTRGCPTLVDASN